MLSRRAFLASGCAVLAQARPVFAADLQARIDAATARREVLRLPAGVIATRGLTLPSGARLVGAPSGTTLKLLGDGPLIAARRADRVSIEGVAFAGAAADAHDGGLLQFEDAGFVTLDSCVVENATRDGLRFVRCGGRIARSTIRGAGRGGLFSLDGAGLTIEDNLIDSCGDNGVQIWQSAQRLDGARILGNRIRKIAARSGGTGQYGNGVSIFRAGGVRVERNHVADCAFSALRDNSGHGVRFLENTCLRSGETAIFAEFAWRDVTISGNLIDGAASGVQMVNFADHGGRGGVCAGNALRGLHRFRDGGGRQWGYECGLKLEAGIVATKNVVEGAPWVGALIGWGPSLADVRFEDNVVRDAPIGVAVSVAPGAGRAVVARNVIERASRSAIAAMEWDRIVGDLSREASRWPLLRAAGNRV
ncbi:MAG: TIGR03808 family TAT-translocated repetitive protein [Methylobacteriaceae bacterium]|nr:TIGR03808 family TAT-translocated repetitive protein [Methylobacteriaceae bacterium]